MKWLKLIFGQFFLDFNYFSGQTKPLLFLKRRQFKWFHFFFGGRFSNLISKVGRSISLGKSGWLRKTSTHWFFLVELVPFTNKSKGLYSAKLTMSCVINGSIYLGFINSRIWLFWWCAQSLKKFKLNTNRPYIFSILIQNINTFLKLLIFHWIEYHYL